jgi:hypothetical protein
MTQKKKLQRLNSRKTNTSNTDQAKTKSVTTIATVENGVLYSKRKWNVREYLNNSLDGCHCDSHHSWRIKNEQKEVD